MNLEDTLDLVLDDRPGFYYVSVIDGGRAARLRGPFGTHGEAADAVGAAKEELIARDPRAHFFAYGTCRAEEDLGSGYLDMKGKET